MYQRYEDSKILLFFLFVYFSLPILLHPQGCKNIKRYYTTKHLTRDLDKCTDERGRA